MKIFTRQFLAVQFLILALAYAVGAQNSTITFTVPTAIVPDLVAGYAAKYGRLPAETPSNTANDAALVRRCTREQWRQIVNGYRADQAETAAPKTVNGDFGSN